MKRFNYYKFILFGATGLGIALGCTPKQPDLSFVFTGEEAPQAPVITDPTTASSYTSYVSAVRIKGCFYADCHANPKLKTNASGTGTLTKSATGFEFNAVMTAGEVRTFSFTTENAKGEVSSPSDITITYDSSMSLEPAGHLYQSSTSKQSPSTSNGRTLEVLSQFPMAIETEQTVGGFVLSTGGPRTQ